MNDNLGKQNTTDDEVDLGFIFTAIGNFFKSLLTSFLNIIVFLYKNRILIILLLVVGIVLGSLWDNYTKKTFKSNFIVSTNYESTDYLYNKIESVNLKLEQKDSIFLKDLLGENSDLVKEIEVEPIVNIYGLINENQANAKLFELLSEDEDIAEFVKEPINSRNYDIHKINIIIEGKDFHETLSSNFFQYLNDNNYYNIEKQVFLDYADAQTKQNAVVIEQIDSILSTLSNNERLKDSQVISFNDEKTIDDLLERKKSLLANDRFFKRMLENNTEVIKIIDSNYSLEYKSGFLSTDKKILVPLVLILFFLSINLIGYFIKKGKHFLEETNK